MIDLKKEFGAKAKVTLEESYGPDSGREKHHYYVVKGRRGEINAWDDTTLEVMVMGVPLKLNPANLAPDKTHNLSLPIKIERMGWKVKNRYSDSTCFLIPKEKFMQAVAIVKAKKRRIMSPEGLERLRQMRSKLRNPLVNGGPVKLIPPNPSQSTPEAR